MQQEIDTGKNMYMEESSGPSIDIGKLVKNLISKLWVMLIVGGIFASIGFAMAKANYVESYSSETTLSFMVTDYVIVKDYSNRKDAPTEYKQETSFYGDSDAKRYQTLLKSDEMVGKIKKRLSELYEDADYSEGFISGALGVAPIPEEISGFFIISVNSTAKAFCERALDVVIETFPEYVQQFDSRISIKVIKSPSAPGVTNSDGATNKAVYGFLAGAAIVAFVVFIITIASNTVTNLESLRRDINAKVLGSIPLIEKPTGLFGEKNIDKV